jgi:hypothetical protein
MKEYFRSLAWPCVVWGPHVMLNADSALGFIVGFLIFGVSSFYLDRQYRK